MGSRSIPILIIISLIAGFIAAFLSLAISALFPVTPETGTTYGTWPWILLFASIEEISKWALLIFLFNTSSIFSKLTHALLSALIFGMGFSAFEILLITMQNNQPSAFSLLFLLVIHTVTAMFIAFGIAIQLEKKNKWITLSYLLLAIIIHLCYNLSVLAISV